MDQEDITIILTELQTWAGTETVGVYPDPISGGNTDLREVRRYVATDHPYHVYEEGA